MSQTLEQRVWNGANGVLRLLKFDSKVPYLFLDASHIIHFCGGVYDMACAGGMILCFSSL